MGRNTTNRQSVDMIASPLSVRFSALAGPVLLMLYGVLRLIDGLDGGHGPGPAWNLGHALFFIAFVLLGVLTAGMWQLVPTVTVVKRIVAGVAMLLGLFGAGCFLWVILGDLFAGFRDAAPLPDVLEMIGPLLFQIGVLTLLVMLATTRPRRLPVWSPPLVLVGFLVFAANLDLIPIGAVLVLAGLAPLAKARRAGPS